MALISSYIIIGSTLLISRHSDPHVYFHIGYAIYVNQFCSPKYFDKISKIKIKLTDQIPGGLAL